ncbi:hypothetical protein [Polyangium aurulentum]|uniref:hypothetical protein n=1 Tax=Polyangium aurulentum TaxID=2567896 RepID=UPI0010AEE17B|nr:hypothetical protein [Polyangium aurulentum]UQA56010.1 hypothetical protein E8A73_032430 [Polyangium aurulentum]
MTTPKLVPALLASLLGCLVLAACSGGDDRDDTGSGSGAQPPAKIGEFCRTTEQCIPGAFCQFRFAGCGIDPTETGLCQPRPASCDGALFFLACGCDGVVYDNVCEANQAGQDFHQQGATCDTPPEGRFACGFTFCQEGVEHCKLELQGEFFFARCLPLPDACMPPASATCACMPDNSDCPCSQDAEGNLKLDCTGK